MAVNKLILIGFVGKVSPTKSDEVTNFSLAVTEKWKKDGEFKEHTEWFSCVAFGKLAKVVNDYVITGSKLYIEGKIRTEKYEKDGEQKSVIKVIVGQLQMVGGKSKVVEETGQSVEPLQDFDAESFDNDIPF